MIHDLEKLGFTQKWVELGIVDEEILKGLLKFLESYDDKSPEQSVWCFY
jgi:hypothetical protein